MSKLKIKDFFSELKKIDLKFIFLLLFATIVPIIYSTLRLIWITDQGSTTYAMTNFESYIQAFEEVISSFLIIPIFTYRKQDRDSKSNSLLVAIIFASFLMFSILLALMLPMSNEMQELNPGASKKDLLSFLSITSASSALKIIETYLICEFALDKNTLKGIFVVTFSLLLRILVDILMISNIAVIPFSIINYALSSFISSLLICFLLVFLYFWKYKKINIKQNISFHEILNFYKRGIFPGLDKLIANFFYTFVTLQIVQHLSVTDNIGWNSWHLGMWIYWHIIFKITNIFKYSLYSETLNNKDIDENKITIIYSLFSLILFIILGPILSLTILKNVVDNNDWLKLTTTTSLIMIPFMLTIAISDMLKIRMIADNNFKFVLLNTIVSNFSIEFPVLIIMLCGYQFSYWDNFAIWMATITLSFILSIFFYWLNLKNKTLLSCFKKI